MQRCAHLPENFRHQNPCDGAAEATPRRTYGGCAFRGAKLALQPIADAIHLVHGPIVCQGHSWQSRPTNSSGPTIHRISFTTALSDLDVALGGEKRLARSLDEIVGQYDPPAVFVYATCVPAMSGDDVRAVCRSATARLGRPILAVDAPGFTGGKLDGANTAAQVLLDDVIGTREPDRTTPMDILLIGDCNVAGEAEHISALLQKAGIRVAASIPGDGRYNAIAGAHRARAALVHCSQSLASLGPMLYERFAIPYATISFYGAANTSAALRTAARLLTARGAPQSLMRRVEETVATSEAALTERLAPLLPHLKNKRALLLTGGVKSWSLADTLQRLGMTLAGVSIQKTSVSDLLHLQSVIGSECQTYNGLGRQELDDLLDQGGIDVVLGGGFSRYTVTHRAVAWVEVNHERTFALTGYDGTVALAEAIVAALKNPLWSILRQSETADGSP